MIVSDFHMNAPKAAKGFDCPILVDQSKKKSRLPEYTHYIRGGTIENTILRHCSEGDKSSTEKQKEKTRFLVDFAFFGVSANKKFADTNKIKNSSYYNRKVIWHSGSYVRCYYTFMWILEMVG